MKTDIPKLFECLSQHNVSSAVIRNYRDTHTSYPSGDLDILVLDGYRGLLKVRKAVDEFCLYNGWKIYLSSVHSNVSINLYLVKRTSLGVVRLNLEFRTCLLYYENRGYRSIARPYLFGFEVRDSIRFHHSVPVIKKEFEFLNLIFELIFESKLKYWRDLQDLLGEERDNPNLRGQIASKIGPRLTSELFDLLVSGSVDALANQADRLRVEIGKQVRRTRFWNFARDLMAVFTRVKNYVRPAGKFIVCLGPDGSGKTYLCDEFSSKNQRAFPRINRVHLGNRPILLPSFRGGGESLGPSNQLDSQSSVNFHTVSEGADGFSVYSAIRFMYHAADHIVHYWLVIRPSIGSGNLFLSERYIFDYLCR